MQKYLVIASIGLLTVSPFFTNPAQAEDDAFYEYIDPCLEAAEEGIEALVLCCNEGTNDTQSDECQALYNRDAVLPEDINLARSVDAPCELGDDTTTASTPLFTTYIVI